MVNQQKARSNTQMMVVSSTELDTGNATVKQYLTLWDSEVRGEKVIIVQIYVKYGWH